MAPSKNTEREAREARERLRRYNARQSVHTHQVKRRTRDNLVALVVLVLIAAIATVTQVYYFSSGPGAKPKAAATSTPTPSASPSSAAGSDVGAVPPATLGGGKLWNGALTLNKAKLGIQLNGKLAPQAVSSVVNDIQTGFLTDKACWRLTDETDFYVIQCGGSSGSDTGGSPYNFGPLENTPGNNTYPAGSIVMARLGGNAYGEGHQFFIAYKTTKIPSDAAGGYSIIGKVTSGLATLNSEITSKGVAKGLQDGAPTVPTKITAVTIKAAK